MKDEKSLIEKFPERSSYPTFAGHDAYESSYKMWSDYIVTQELDAHQMEDMIEQAHANLEHLKNACYSADALEALKSYGKKRAAYDALSRHQYIAKSPHSKGDFL